jgi:hypothetical protein
MLHGPLVSRWWASTSGAGVKRCDGYWRAAFLLCSTVSRFIGFALHCVVRQQIESRNVAHIMNNEAQRKYLVSIKRLMSYLQDKRTDVPPSKKVR